ALLRLLLGLIKALPRRFVPVLASVYAWIAYRFAGRDRGLIERNVELVYKLPSQSIFSKTFQRQVFRTQAIIALETFKHQFSKRELIRFEGRERFKAAMEKISASGNGLIFVTAHHGSWELVANEIARATGKTFVALAKPSKLPEFTDVLTKLRGKADTRVLYTDSKNLLRDMIKTLKENGNLGFVMDQKPEGRVGPIVEFLGQPTEFVTGPAKLAARHGSPVVAIFCMRTGPWEYRIEFETVVGPDQNLQDEQFLTQKMATAITRSIQIYPEQWIWNYKRWRSPAPLSNPE
ncbi:MAG: lysophospholipid acyltransferase family protein, partial [Bdellovibrionota bacterium]